MDTYNPCLVGKFIELAGHPNTPAHEATNALRKAYGYCAKHGVTLSEVVSFVNDGFFLQITKMSQHDFLLEIAELKFRNSELAAEVERLASGAAVEANVEELPASEAMKNTPQETRKVDQGADRDMRDLDGAAESTADQCSSAHHHEEIAKAERASSADALGEVDQERTAVSRRRKRGHADRQVGRRGNANEANVWSRIERTCRTLLSMMGCQTAAIARKLSRLFGLKISVAEVSRMHRQRWAAGGHIAWG